jgi:hypothetical protein
MNNKMTVNELLVKKEIALKNLIDIPYRHYQTNVITQEGRAYFPYPDWFRGEYMSDIPIVVEREAGFRPLEEQNWKGVQYAERATGHAYPQHCFRGSEKTRYPCYPECTSRRGLMPNSKIYLYR